MQAISVKTFIEKLEEARKSEGMEENPTLIFSLGDPIEGNTLLPESIFKAQTSEGEYVIGVNLRTQQEILSSWMEKLLEDSNNAE